MADKKISDLTALSAPANADLFAIVDVSANTTKKITYANLLAQIQADIEAADIFALKTGVVLLGGNTDGAEMYIGTLDDYGVHLYINNQERFAINNQGDAAVSADVQYQNTSETHTGYYNGTEHKRHLLLTRDSTNATPIELTTTGLAASGVAGRIEIPADTAYHVRVDVIVKQNGAADSKKFTREFCISNNGGTTALQGSVETIGSDAGNASLSTCAITITANDTDDTMKIMATGVAATNLSWTATVYTTKITDR